MKSLILFSIVGVATAVYAKSAVVVECGNVEQKEFVLDADPSMVAVTNECPTASDNKPYKERWRIVSDLNGDEVDDLILSDPKESFGNAGGSWMVCINSLALRWVRHGQEEKRAVLAKKYSPVSRI